MKKLRNSQSVKSLCAGLLLIGAVAGTCNADLSGWITFGSDHDGDQDIWAVRADGTGLTQLVNMPGNQTWPRWSLDSRKIAYTAGADTQVWVYDWASKTNTKIYDGDDYGGQHYLDGAAWSPDGSRILFYEESSPGTRHITVVNADGTGRAVVPTQPGFVTWPSWSPSGKAFGYCRRDGFGENLWIYDFTATGDILNGTDHQLTQSGTMQPYWGPSRDIAFATWWPNPHNLGIIDPGQSPDWADPAHPDVTFLTNDASFPSFVYTTPAWSPDGSHLVYAHLTTDGAVDLWTMDVSTLTQTRLIALDGYDCWPDWGNPDAVPLPGAALLGCLGLGTALGILRRHHTR
jgi:TolB protein